MRTLFAYIFVCTRTLPYTRTLLYTPFVRLIQYIIALDSSLFILTGELEPSGKKAFFCNNVYSEEKGMASAANLISRNENLCNLFENSCSSCKQTISPAEQWYLRCHFKAFGDLQY
jgi:hypothetical protein